VLKERHNVFAVTLEREFRPKRKQNRLRKGEKQKGFCVRLSLCCVEYTRTEPTVEVTQTLLGCSCSSRSGYVMCHSI